MKNHKLFIFLIVTFAVSSVFSQITKNTIEPPGLPDIYSFGHSVGGYGEYAIVGAPNSHSNGIFQQGAVLVYKKNNNAVWTYDQMLIPSDSIAENHFGFSVAMNSEFILASNRDRTLYVFKLNNSNIWKEYEIITNSAYDAWTTVISGNYAIMGGGDFGEFTIFHFNGNNWIRQLYSGDPIKSVSTDGEYAIVGVPGDNFGTGMALIYKRDGDVWSEQIQLTASDAHFNDRFGWSVSIDSDYAVVGASDHNEGYGAAYIFKRDGSDWIEQTILKDIDSGSESDFGSSVLIKENVVVVAAANGSRPPVESFSVLSIYERDLIDWDLFYRTEEENYFANQIAMTNNFIISGFYTIIPYNWVYIYEGLNITSIESINDVQLKSFTIHQNYPNPFNPTTTIKYQIPELSFVTLKVYDVLGMEIATLINGEKEAGSYSVELNATDLPSGIYFYRLQAGNPSTGSGQSFVETKKMVLLR